MRMIGRVCGSWLGVAALSLVIAGCSEASKTRWNNFWGMNQPEEKRPVAKGRRDRDAKARPKKVARSDSPKPEKRAGRDSRPAEVGQEVDKYVAAMPPRGGRTYVDDDLTSKIERQQDPNRRRRIKNAAATRSPAGRRGGDGVAARSPNRTDGSTPGIRSESGRSPVMQAAEKEQPPIPAESRSDRSRLNGEDSASTGRPLSPALGEQIGGGAGDTSDSATGPGTSDAAKVGDGDSGRTDGRLGSESLPAEAPVLKNVRVAAAPEPVAVKKPAATRKQPKAREPVAPIVKPQDNFAIDLAKQAELVRKDPNNIEEQYRLRMMYLINGEDEKALEPVPGVNADIQEIIEAQIKALISARSSSGRDPATWANRQLASIEELRRRMRARADLVIPKVVLCTAIEGFGRYEPIEPPEFLAGQKNLVLIYIEVDNFTSPKTPSGMYRTLLSVRQHLLTRDGQEMWSKRDENIEDLARQQRRDFFLVIGPIAIPKALAPGEYSLKVEVEDMQAGKLNSSVAKFKIVP